jgi:hypothetical protein
MYDQAA